MKLSTWGGYELVDNPKCMGGKLCLRSSYCIRTHLRSFSSFLKRKGEGEEEERGGMSTVKIPPVAPSARDDAMQIYRAFKGQYYTRSYSFLYSLFLPTYINL